MNSKASATEKQMVKPKCDVSNSTFSEKQDGLLFCLRAYEHFDKLISSPNGISKLRNRSTDEVYKKFLEEIIPISRYLRFRYQLELRIEIAWVDGDQHFDGKLTASGYLVDHGEYPRESDIEVTCAVHGKAYLTWEKLNADGYTFGPEGIRRENGQIISEPTSHDIQDWLDSYATIAIDRITQKANNKGYASIIALVVYCDFDSIIHDDEWRLFCSIVKSRLPIHNFFEIFLCCLSDPLLNCLILGTNRLGEN